MKPSTQLVLAGLGGFAAGAFLMGLAARKNQAAALQTEAQLAAAQGAGPTLQLASSTTSLNVGWNLLRHGAVTWG